MTDALTIALGVAGGILLAGFIIVTVTLTLLLGFGLLLEATGPSPPHSRTSAGDSE